MWLRLTLIVGSAMLIAVWGVMVAGVLLPHGAQLAFLSHPDALTMVYQYDIMLYDVRHGVQVPVLQLASAPPQMKWSPDGSTLAYLQSGLSRSLTLFHLEDRRLQDLTLGVFLPLTAVPLVWSADGEHIAFAARRIGLDGAISEASALAVINLASGRVYSPLTTSYRNLTAVQWSPTEPNVLAFAADNTLYRVDVAASRPSPQVISSGSSFTWSADGARLVAYSHEDDLLTVTEIGGASGRVPVTIDGMITWAPNGSELIYSDNPNSSFDLFHFDINTGVTTTLSGMRTYEGQPSWSAGGRWVAYVATLDGHDNIMLYDRWRGARFRLRRLDARNWSPVWRPPSSPNTR